MRNINADFQTALIQSREVGIVPRRFLYITAKNRSTGAKESMGFWTGDDDISINVISPSTGAVETRTYYGVVNLDIAAIKRVSDLTVQTIEVRFSQIDERTQEVVRGYDVRLAKCEIHEMLMDPVSRRPISEPFPVFLGEVDSAPITTPSVGSDGDITLNLVSDAISMLTRSNPKKSSYESQKRRNNDQFGKYGSTIETWTIRWGQK